MGGQDSTDGDPPGRLEGTRRRLKEIGARRVILYLVLIGGVVLYLSPLWSGFMTSMKSDLGFAVTPPYAPPPAEHFVVEPWFTAANNMASGMVNSFLFTLPATVLSAFLGSLAAFGLTKIRWRGQLAILVLFVMGVFIPYQSVLVPLRLFWSVVDVAGALEGLAAVLAWTPMVPDLVRSIAGKSDLIELMVTHTAYGIPICTVLFRGYYFTIDDEIIEAAKVDGASTFRIYRRIVLPLSKPMFAVTLIYQFTNIWNDLLFALVLVTTSANHVATQALNLVQGAMVQQYNIQMAAAFIVAFPTLIIYIVFGRQFAKGIAGAGT